MRSLLLIMFVSSVLVFINSANAFQCPGVVRVPQTGNIVKLSEVDMEASENEIVFPSTVSCVYTYTSTSTDYYGEIKTFKLKYTDHFYFPINVDNWDLNSAKCYSSNPADCDFLNVFSSTYVQGLERCPDTVTDPGGGKHYFDDDLDGGNGPVGTIKCMYGIYQNDVNHNAQRYEGLYFNSTGHSSNKDLFWKYLNNGQFMCAGDGSGYEGNPLHVNPDQCEFYLANP